MNGKSLKNYLTKQSYLLFDKSKELVEKSNLAPFLGSFKSLNSLKSSKYIPKQQILTETQLETKYQHMTDVLGHVELLEDNIPYPVPIFCLHLTKDNILITGDTVG